MWSDEVDGFEEELPADLDQAIKHVLLAFYSRDDDARFIKASM